MSTSRRWLATGLLACAGGCYASNVVAREDRAVVSDTAELAWSDAPRALEPGLYESIEIRGEAAARIWKVYYVFEASGRYTGAALVVAAEGLEFQTLTGTWRTTDDGLVLDDAAAVPLRHAPAHVRLDAPTGSVILHRVDLQ